MDQVNSSVLMIGWEYPPHNSGGLGVACDGLTRALAEQNTQVYFTLPYAYPSSLSHLEVIDCSHPAWSLASNQAPFSSYARELKTNSFRASDLSERRSLPSSLMEERVQQYADQVALQTKPFQETAQLIHAHDWMSFPAAQKLKAQTGQPFIAHIHSTEYDRIPSGGGSSFIIETEQAGFEAADQIIAVSYYTKHLLIHTYGIPEHKIAVVHNGIAPRTSLATTSSLETTFAPGQPVIVFMGRLTMQKGGEYFIRMARQVAERVPEALFVVAGDGDLYHHLLFNTATNHLTARVLFTGFVRDAQQAQLLDRADVFVMPSLSEPFGIVALEAAQRQTPVIVSQQSGVAEVLPSALKIDFWDIDKMAKTVLELIENRRLSRRVVARQNQELTTLTWDRAATQIQTIYRAFIGR
jgi:glycogen(starch) synthase